MDYWKATADAVDSNKKNHEIVIFGYERDSETTGEEEAQIRILMIARKHNFSYKNILFKYIDEKEYDENIDSIERKRDYVSQ
jgi:hypothetical protein